MSGDVEEESLHKKEVVGGSNKPGDLDPGDRSLCPIVGQVVLCQNNQTATVGHGTVKVT